MENPIKMEDFGVPPFMETPIYQLDDDLNRILTMKKWVVPSITKHPCWLHLSPSRWWLFGVPGVRQKIYNSPYGFVMGNRWHTLKHTLYPSLKLGEVLA